MSEKHTPGPWKFNFEFPNSEWTIVTTAGGRIIANVNADSRQEANSHLISAAPELLETLKRVIAESDRDTLAYRDAKAAIAKAEGRA